MVAWIGTSGWSYDHWHPELYPPGLAPGSRLGRYSAAFPTAELNSSFYRWPAPAAFRSWRDRLPDGFRLSVKAPRGLTHARKLYAPETWLQRIREGWHELGDKRAVLLVQLPPSQPRDDTRLAYFLRLVPDWIRVAVEFRHQSWHCEETYALLAERGTAYCVMSGANLPCVLALLRISSTCGCTAGSEPPVRRLVPRSRPEVVGRPNRGVEPGGPRRVRLLQQRR